MEEAATIIVEYKAVDNVLADAYVKGLCRDED